MGHDLSHLPIVVQSDRLPCVQAIDVAVEHAEDCRDQARIVNLLVCGAMLARPCDFLRRNVLAALLDPARNREQLSVCRRSRRWHGLV
jgi:hypothetical protein